MSLPANADISDTSEDVPPTFYLRLIQLRQHTRFCLSAQDHSPSFALAGYLDAHPPGPAQVRRAAKTSSSSACAPHNLSFQLTKRTRDNYRIRT